MLTPQYWNNILCQYVTSTAKCIRIITSIGTILFSRTKLSNMLYEIVFQVFGEWVLGAIACKAIVYGQMVTLASTTFILTTMSYDRFQAICSPLRSTGGVKQAKRMIAASWFLAFIFAIPQLFIFVQVGFMFASSYYFLHKFLFNFLFYQSIGNSFI